MEKFHKYCLSVLLVIICSNISAQGTHDFTGSDDYKTLCKLYGNFLNSGDCNDTPEFSLYKKLPHCNSINQKQSVGDIIASGSAKQQNFGFYHHVFGIENYDKVLDGYKEKEKGYNFVETVRFKNKVSKIRNKDYLDLIS